MIRKVASLILVGVLTAGYVPAGFSADPGAPAFTNAKEAGVDYALQGEYAGNVQTDNGAQAVGVQVIALGDGMFRAMGFVGGLPGAGWKRGDEMHMADGKLENGVVKFAGDKASATLREGELTIESEGREIGKLPKTERTNPTLGAKPPAGAIVLFDGTSLDEWQNGALVEEKLLGATNVSTKRTFGDHQLHIEFRTPFMPKSTGQARGNSGVYIQGRYELQVLDSFGLEGKNNECGGIYSIAEPQVNMCLPPLAWQTYDIDFTAARYDSEGKKTANARVTIRHNGVLIHDNLELSHGTPGYHAEGPGPDGLFLQNHGNPVAFRNIWDKESTGTP